MQEPQEPQEGQPPGAGLTDQQQGALVQLGQMMGPHTDEFDERVQQHLDEAHGAEHKGTDYEKEFGQMPHERQYQKMRAAQTGGGGAGLGPEEEAQLLAKQQQTLQQQAAAQAQQQAAQAQAQQQPHGPPPAPTGPQGVSQPYPAQAGQQQPEEEQK
jgi:hypothetical protein